MRFQCVLLLCFAPSRLLTLSNFQANFVFLAALASKSWRELPHDFAIPPELHELDIPYFSIRHDFDHHRDVNIFQVL